MSAPAGSPPPRRAVPVAGLLALLALPALALVVVTPLAPSAQLGFAAGLFLLALLVDRSGRRTATWVLTLISATVTVRYLVWRLTATLPLEWSLDFLLGGGLFLAELYSFAVTLLGHLQAAHPLRRRPVPLPADRGRWPTVDVLIPTFGEPLEIVQATVLAAQAMDWPSDKLRVCLLDDGHRPELRQFAAQAGASYFSRQENRGAKAGNLNAALARTSGALVAFFDCDHVPTRSFLQLTVGFFLHDEHLALVQTPHHFYSPDPFERNLRIFRRTPNEGELFYSVVQPGNDLWNATFFCGSCALLRRRALEEVGGVAADTVTEDAHTALRLHRRGWSSVYLDLRLAAGLATESLSGHVRQRIRWARGMAQILRVDNPLFGRGLSLAQRLCYLNAMLYFFCGLPRLVFLTAPLAFLLLGAQIFNAAPAVVLSYALPHLALAVLTSARQQGGSRSPFWGELYETVLAPYIVVPTALALLAPRAGRFNVTAKGGIIERPGLHWRIAVPYLVLLAGYAVGITLGVHQLLTGGAPADAVLINLGWSCYNVVLLAAAVGAAFETRQVRRLQRVELRLPAVVRLSSGHTLDAVVHDLSLSGAGLTCPGQDLAPGDPLTLGLLLGREELPLTARVTELAPGRLRLAFDGLTLSERRSLVRALYSRADAWLPDAARPAAGPLGSLLGLARHGGRGLLRLAAAPLGARRTA